MARRTIEINEHAGVPIVLRADYSGHSTWIVQVDQDETAVPCMAAQEFFEREFWTDKSVKGSVNDGFAMALFEMAADLVDAARKLSNSGRTITFENGDRLTYKPAEATP